MNTVVNIDDHRGDKPPPLANLEAEQALLGALLINNRALALIGFLRPEHFAERIHADMFATIRRLNTDGMVADATTLKPLTPEVPGVPFGNYPAHLVANAATVINAPDYARAIYDLALRRALKAVGEDVAGMAGDAGFSLQGRAQLDDLVQRSGELQALFPDPRLKPEPTYDEVVADAEDRMRSGRHWRGVPCGLAGIDNMIGGFAPGDFIVIGARPSQGKTMLALSLARRASSKGVGVGYDSIEMTAGQLRLRLISDELNTDRHCIPYKQLGQGHFSERLTEPLREAAKRLSGRPLHVIDRGNRLADVPDHLRRARRAVEKAGAELAIFIVDYLGLLAPGDRYAGQRTNEVGEISGTLKALAKSEGVAILALHQLNRQNEARHDKRPQLSDLRDSGALEQDADAVLFVHREAYYLERETQTPERDDNLEKIKNKMEVIVAKQRQGPVGPIKLWCQPDINAVRDSAHE